MKTLKDFLEKNRGRTSCFDFAKDLTLEEFLNTCQRGDWILWLFTRMNPNSLREVTLAKAHCVNTVRHLMKDDRSTKAVDVAIAFGECRATRKELDDAADAAHAAADAAAYAAAYAADGAAYVAAGAAYAAAAAAARAAAYAAADAAAYAADAAYVAASAAAKKENKKQTADICRKYLPIEIWNNN